MEIVGPSYAAITTTLIGLAAHVILSFQIVRIARKRGLRTGLWVGFIPFLQYFLFARILEKNPVFYIVGLMVPFLNIVLIALLLLEIMRLADKSDIWIILLIISPINIWAMWEAVSYTHLTLPTTPYV